ncbi:MAG: dihydropteroate synthase, partial [Paenibacillus sp. RIFOXYA1_FULL_44_5]
MQLSRSVVIDQLNKERRTLIMGILNVTPDSFSDGGKFNRVELALAHAQQMVQAGADILDIGGESTRPGAQTVTLEEELERVLPVIEVVSREFEVPISIDTYKAEVGRQALIAGAHILNDIWGFRQDPQMAETAAQFQCPVILMHNRKQIDYTNFLQDVVDDLQQSIQIAQHA